MPLEPFILEQGASLFKLVSWETQYPGLLAGFTARSGGQSQPPYDSQNCGLHVGDNEQSVINNRKRLCERLNFSFDHWTCAEQVHGNKVAIVTKEQCGAGKASLRDAIADTDGLITAEKNVLLTSFYADCVPLFFAAPKQRVIGIAHAGWSGTVKKISHEMLRIFADHFSVRPSELKVAIGPSIGSCCYEVDDRVAVPLSGLIPAQLAGQYVKPDGKGKYFADLKEINRYLLYDQGVHPQNIAVSSWCTSCRTDLFFSHRKERGQTGRMAAYIGWRKEV